MKQNECGEFSADIPNYQNPLSGRMPFRANCGLSHSFGEHWHGEVEIIYMMPGSAPREIQLEDRVYTLQERDAIFIGSGEIHALIGKSNGAVGLVLEMGFSLLGADFEFFARNRFQEPVIRFSEQVPEPLAELENLFRKIAALTTKEQWEGGHSTARKGATLRMQVISGLFEIAALLTESMPMVPVSGQKARQMQAMLAIQPVLAYVREYYNRPISLEYAAALSGYEKTRFCQLFKRSVGRSFHQYLTECRTKAAVSMLQETELPIGEIAEVVGIPQAKTFSRVIREAYGKSPRELREEAKWKNEGRTERIPAPEGTLEI